MRFSTSLVLLSTVCCCLAQYPGATAPPKELARGFDSITVKDAKRVLTYLATQCDGRGTGQPGFEKAAQYMAQQFKSIGLKPLGDNGTYFQKTEFTRWRFDPTSIHLSLAQTGLKLDGKEIVLRGGPASIDVNSPLVVLSAPTDAMDLDGQSFKGDIVILQSDKRNSYLESIVLDSGADAVLYVVKKIAEGTWHPRMGPKPSRTPPRTAGTISADAVAKIVKALGAAEKTELKTKSGLNVVTYPKSFHFQAKLAVETVQVGNVVGKMVGSDPKLADEYVGVGGHLDHLGDNDGVVFPGADDDGSGSTAVVEVARAMAANKLKPRRSIVFMTFFGEEMGLLGSKFLTDHPPVPLDHMVAELQMDMVGRDSDGSQNGDPNRVDVAAENVDTIRLVGSKRISTELDKTIQQENACIGFKFKYDAEDVYTRSDHYNFANKGIPIAFLFDGFHPDYHRPTDTVDKIDWLKLTSAARLYYLTALTVANADQPPVKDVKGS